MKYNTKQGRLCAVVKAYMRLVDRPVTMEEVSDWALRHDLYPPPKRGSSVEAAEEWECKLDQAIINSQKEKS